MILALKTNEDSFIDFKPSAYMYIASSFSIDKYPKIIIFLKKIMQRLLWAS